MKVLLTGATGFVGSHVLDALQARQIPTAILLRSSSSHAYIRRHLPAVDTRIGSITDPPSLPAALKGVSHVIHCAGCTKASHPSDYERINHRGTANLIDAVNAHAGGIEKFVHISSLAASGPAIPERPAREDDVPNPVSAYGRTKLAGESEVRNRCRASFTIIRPPAVYGPRDTAFLPLFKAVGKHLLPLPSKRQALSLVYIRDLAEAVIACLQNPITAGRAYFVSSREVVTARQMAALIAERMKIWTIPVPVPSLVLWPICLLQEAFARCTNRPTLLNLQKFAELGAPGWVCDPSRLEHELGVRCETLLASGISQTLDWYRQENWL